MTFFYKKRDFFQIAAVIPANAGIFVSKTSWKGDSGICCGKTGMTVTLSAIWKKSPKFLFIYKIPEAHDSVGKKTKICQMKMELI